MADPLAVVIVTYNSAPDLPGTLDALLPQLREDDELVVVDCGSDDDPGAVLAQLAPRAQLLDLGANRGFAGGANAGVDATSAPLIFLLNPDARVQPGALDALRAAATDQPGWGAWQALVTMEDGRTVNTSGGVTHWLGFGWAGGCGEPVAAPTRPYYETSFASGAALVVRREAWTAAEGFSPEYFMYGEDLDLALRLRLGGWGIGVVPAARVEHDYTFTKGDYKWFYLERNRWWTLLGAYPARLLALLLPALLAFELALLPVAFRGGWGRAKLRAQLAVLRSLPWALRRRARVQRARTASASAFARALTASLDSPYLDVPVPALVTLQASYWRGVRGLVGAARG